MIKNMNTYEKNILNLLKARFEETVGSFPYRTESQMQRYWLQNYENNLIHTLSDSAKKAYGEGAGNEISTGKMGALKSSSALTYNLFGNGKAEIIHATHGIGNGNYTVEFEKKYKTIKRSNAPAHLDAFLYCSDSKEAIACEMKMTEWLFNKPSALSASYLIHERYIDSIGGEAFVKIAEQLQGIPIIDNNGKCTKYEAKFKNYDAAQMFKHALALYRDCYENRSNQEQNIQKLTLLNCVWTLTSPQKLETVKAQQQYSNTLSKETTEFENFSTLMEPIKVLFKKVLGIDFDIRFCTFAELLSMLNKTEDELKKLQRYII